MAGNKNFVRVSDFAKSRYVDRNAVTQFIRRHPEMFEGHTEQRSDGMYFDDAAMLVLDQKYPLPSPVEVIPDTKSRDELIVEMRKNEALRDKVASLQQELNDTKLLLVKKEDEMLRLEDKAAKVESEGNELKDKLHDQNQELREKSEELIRASVSLEYTQKELDQKNEEINQKNNELEKEKERVAAAEEELKRMKSASLWKRLTRKW